MLTPPTGTVTFLFTDIEESTQLWQRHPAAMPAALARHDALLRHIIEMNYGHVFKTVGDSFYAAFRTPVAAIGAALDVQTAVLAEKWVDISQLRVRVALHTGAAEERDGDYFGGPVNLVARLLSAGHGGQILLSAAARELLRGSLPEGVTLRDLGEQRLKGFDRSERVFQLDEPSLPGEFPPLRVISRGGICDGNLPVEVSSFIGRERELREVRQLLGTTHLLNLVGAGGTGKTRVALQLGASLAPEFPDGVWLVELATILDGPRVVHTVAAALCLSEEPGRSIRETLIAWLRPRRLLLILDNCEQVAEAAAELVQALLRACPSLRLLITSRHVLGVPGEIAWPVPALTVPNLWGDPLSGEEIVRQIEEFEGVRLFVERAKAVQPSFELTAENAPLIAKICWNLDGIALAIELAAVRVKILSLEQIDTHLSDRFHLLAARHPGVLPRQQTMLGLIDWSYDLLSEKERLLLHRLPVFSRGRTLDAVETVCSGDGLERLEILDLLSQLVDKSMLLIERDADGMVRYAMSESIWDYSRAKLEASAEIQTIRDRHMEYFAVFAREALGKIDGPERITWLHRIEAERGNLRRALQRSREVPGCVGKSARLGQVIRRGQEIRDWIGRQN